MGMRQVPVMQLRRITADIGPIDPVASKLPGGGPGCPAGKKFDLVLTCDIEDPHGLVCRRQLAEREREVGGYASAFDGALMPRLQNNLVHRLNPKKLTKSLAFGLPLVTTEFLAASPLRCGGG
jgi:hypothetical protein